MSEVPVVGRKKVWVTSILLVSAILAGYLLYGYVIPRAEMDLKVIYQEGTMGTMTLDVRLSNTGTVDVADVNVSVEIEDENGVRMMRENAFYGSISTGGRKEIHLNMSGDHYLDHVFRLNLSFYAEGKRYSVECTIEEDGGYMKPAYERTVRDWFPG